MRLSRLAVAGCALAAALATGAPARADDEDERRALQEQARRLAEQARALARRAEQLQRQADELHEQADALARRAQALGREGERERRRERGRREAEPRREAPRVLVPRRDDDRRRAPEPESQPPRAAYLGVQIGDLPGDHGSRRYGVRAGALVSRVLDGSPADRAGLRPDDVILAVGERAEAVGGAEDFRRLVARYGPGESIVIHLDRDGWRRALRVELGARPRQEPQVQPVPDRFLREERRERMQEQRQRQEQPRSRARRPRRGVY